MRYLAGLIGLAVAWLVARWVLGRRVAATARVRLTRETRESRAEAFERNVRANAQPTTADGWAPKARTCPCGASFVRPALMVEPLCDACVLKRDAAEAEKVTRQFEAMGFERTARLRLVTLPADDEKTPANTGTGRDGAA